MKLILLVMTIIIPSCSGPTENNGQPVDATKDSLPNLPFKDAEFTAIKNNNAIALNLRRVNNLSLEYRIELNRQWKGSTLDKGRVEFKELIGDSCFVFQGQNSNCKLSIMIYADSLKQDIYTQIERLCGDTTQNIRTKEFPKIWLKGFLR